MLSKVRGKIMPLLEPVAGAFVRAGFTPNGLTLFGLIVGLVSACLFAKGELQLACLALLICGFFDAIDGMVARLSGGQTAFGGVLDSVIDRYVELMVFVGIIYGDLGKFLDLPGRLWAVLALGGSMMVSYIRARAEAAGSGTLDIGIAERGERILILAIGGFLNLMLYAIVLIAFLSHLTVLQRLIVSRRHLG